VTTIPAFSLAGSDGRTWTRDDLAGKTTVLYFYPRDQTPGCTREACAFRDRKAAFARLGAQVVGVSPDGLEAHAKFIAKERLNFVLLADPEHRLAEPLGAWGEKVLYGKRSLGIIRSTFIVGPDLGLAKVWRKVSVDGHDEQVLAALTDLAGR
jgi:peroxiredoxin Q/BCP